MWTMLEDQTEQNGAISDINIIMIQVKPLKLQFNGVLLQVLFTIYSQQIFSWWRQSWVALGITFLFEQSFN